MLFHWRGIAHECIQRQEQGSIGFGGYISILTGITPKETCILLQRPVCMCVDTGLLVTSTIVLACSVSGHGL